MDSRPEQRIQEQGAQEICITGNTPGFNEPIVLWTKPNNLFAILTVTVTFSLQDKSEVTLMPKFLTHFTVLRLVPNEYGGRERSRLCVMCNTSHLSELKCSYHLDAQDTNWSTTNCRASLYLAMFDRSLYILVSSCRRHVRWHVIDVNRGVLFSYIENSGRRFLDFDPFYICFFILLLWLWWQGFEFILKWIVQYSQSFLFVKLRKIGATQKKTLACVKVAFRQKIY